MKAEQGLTLPDGRQMRICGFGPASGIPLIALHGTPGSCLMMRPGDEHVQARGIHMIAPDRPGYGGSMARGGYLLADWVEDMRFALDELEIERFMLFGVSGGGPFASALAALMPERVTALALVSPVGLFDTDVRSSLSASQKLLFEFLPRHPLLMHGLVRLARQLLLRAPRLALSMAFFRFSPADKALLRQSQHLQDLVATFQDGVRPGIEGVVEDLRLFSSDWALPLEQITAPACVWQGDEDRQVPASAARRLAAAIDAARLQPLPGQGHFWVLDHFDEVLDQLLRMHQEAIA